MQYLGPIDNTQFAFSDGLLTGFRILTHRKRSQGLKEKLVAATELQMGPIAPAVYQPDHPQTLPPAGSSVVQTRWIANQDFSAGRRTLEVSIDSLPDAEDEAVHELKSTLTLSLDLEIPLAWEVRIDAATVESSNDPHRLLLRRSNNVTIELSSDLPLTVATNENDGVSISAALPAGHSQISLNISSSPYFRILDTAVVCRPSQLREAAVVLSCLPSDLFVPLFIADPPPVSREEYTSLYARFQEAHDTSMADLMGMGYQQTLEGTADNSRRVREQIQAHWKLQEELTPYRSWVKRNQQLSALLSDAGLKRLVLLFPAKQSDFETINPELPAKEREELPAYLNFPPEDCEIICLLKDTEPQSELAQKTVAEYRYTSLTELSDLAWEKLRGTTPPPRSIEIAHEEDWAYLLALHDALREQVPLRPAAGIPLRGRNEHSRPAATDKVDEEVVLVEVTGEARDLVGVLYAHLRGVKLVLTATPELREVDEVLVKFNETQLESSRAKGYVAAYADRLQEVDQLTDSEKAEIRRAIDSPDYSELSDYSKVGLIDFVKRFFLTDWETEGLKEIEAAVTRQIPRHVVDEVGERALTVFTCGLPYAFLKRGKSDWAEKTIGHVVNDPDLMILRELFLAGAPRSIFSLSAIFDPGFFQNSETEDVLRSLDDHLTHAMVLAGPVASVPALQELGHLRTLEFLFFNTHGSDNAIMLDMPLQSNRLVQWVSFAGSPIVFNNSCLSWRGVGREFIRIGARGYVGTLWSVDSRDAAIIARNAMGRLTAHRTSVPGSLCNIAVSPSTKRAYIFVGTCNVFLDDWAEVSERHRYEYVKAATAIFAKLLQEAATKVGRSGLYRRSGKPLVKLFHQQLGHFLERLEGLTTDDSAPLLLGRYAELLALADDSGILETTAEYDERVIDLCKTYLKKLNLPADERDKFAAGISQAEARINYRLGKTFEAIEVLQAASGESSDKAPDHENLPSLIEMLKRSGQPETAIEVGLKAKELYQKVNNKTGYITVIGQLCQLYKRTGEFDEALELARSGFTIAAEIDEKFRQPIFKLDECNILQLQGRYDEAIEAAQVASRLFRINHEDGGDLRCFGAIGQCYMEKGDLKAARKWLTDGYNFAMKLQDMVEVANFAGDLGTLEARAGNIEASSKYHLESFGLFHKIGHYEAIPIVINKMLQPCREQRNFKLFGYVLSAQMLIIGSLHPTIAGSVIPVIYMNIAELIRLANEKDLPQLSASLGLAFEFGMAKIRSETAPSDHLKFLLELIAVFGLWVAGQRDAAIERARHLDQASGGLLEIEKLVSEKVGQ